MRSIAGGKRLHMILGITIAILLIVGAFVAVLPSRPAYAGLAPGNTWFLRVHKSLSGDGITDADKAKAHHIKVVATLSLENPSNETNRAGFKETFESRYKNETGSSYTTEVDYDSEDPYIRFTYDNSVTIRNINSPSQLVAMYLNPPSGGPLNFSDLKITYTITEYDVGDYDVYINQEKLTPDADGNVTYTVEHNGAERINGYGIFNQQDKEEDIFINNHKGTDFKEWTIEKVDAVTGEKLNTTFEFMLRQRAGTEYHNNNLERITVKSGDKVMLPYPAVYDVNETQAPERYVPIGANEYRYPIKFNIDGLGNITVTDSSGNYNATVDENTATITIPNYKKEDYTGDIEIKKQVVTSAGGEVPALMKDQEYTLDLEIKDTRSSWLFTINSKFGDVEFVSSKAQVTIKDGETITLKDIPIIETYYGYLNGEWKELTPNSADAVFGIKITEQDGSKYNLTPEGDYLVGEYPRQIIVPSALRQTKSVTLINTIQVYDASFLKTDEAGAVLDGATLRVTDREGNVIDEWVSEDGEAHEIKGAFLAGETYALTETKAPYGYNVADPVTFTFDEDGKITVDGQEAADGTVTMQDKKLPAADLTVTKKVTGAGDKEKSFNFTVTLKDTEGNPLSDMQFGDDKTDAEGKITFTLKDGESKTIAGITEGISYEIEEDDYTGEGYEAVQWSGDHSGKVTDKEAAIKVTATNHKKETKNEKPTKPTKNPDNNTKSENKTDKEPESATEAKPEPEPEPEAVEPTDKNVKVQPEPEATKRKGIDTGDDNDITGLMGIIALSAAALGAFAVRRRREG